MTATLAVDITAPGVYEIPADVYHADPVPGGSLSSTGARQLLPPSCPALYRYERDHPPAPRRVFEIGHAAHKVVLGIGPELVRIDRDVWNTNAVKAEVAAVREAGGVPLKPDRYDQVHAMAAAIRAHPIASTLFQPGYDNTAGNHGGRAEQSLFWQDAKTGVWLRARLDWLPNYTIAIAATNGSRHAGRLIVPDYKTAESASPDDFDRAIYRYGYHIQAAHYLDGITALYPNLVPPTFVFAVQEKAAPYLVTVIQPTNVALRIGRDECVRAREIYRRCVESGQWPGYSGARAMERGESSYADDVELVGLPGWVENEYLRSLS